jgi:nicotinate dehydrogenase subunit B
VTSQNSIKEGEGMGFAFSRYKNSASYCGIAAHLGVAPNTGRVTLIKMWSVTDAGEIINPDGLKNQIEGGMIQSASWALLENVEYDNTKVISRDWYSYPILRFDNIPQVEVHLIDRPDQPPLGAGEAAQGPATAAVVNAIYAASGVRIRHLPVDNELLKFSLKN